MYTYTLYTFYYYTLSRNDHLHAPFFKRKSHVFATIISTCFFCSSCFIYCWFYRMCQTFSISWYNLCCSFSFCSCFFFMVAEHWRKKKRIRFECLVFCSVFASYYCDHAVWCRLIEFTTINPNLIFLLRRIFWDRIIWSQTLLSIWIRWWCKEIRNLVFNF